MGAPSCFLASLCLAGIACAAADGDRDGGRGDAGVSVDGVAACTRPGPRTVRQLAAGSGYSLAVLDNGDVLLWGSVLGYVGGDGKPRQRLVPPFSIDTGCRNAVEAAAGHFHACVRTSDGEVRCWGRNDAGQLGITGLATQPHPARPADLGAGRRAVAIAAGFEHTCARLDDGQLRCFGKQVLDGLDGNQLIPLGDGRTVGAMGAGPHTCAILDDGALRCWGTNERGELGLGDTKPRLRPADALDVDVGPGRRAVEIAAGDGFTCARLDDGQVKCWGANYYGQLGLGDLSPRSSPTRAVALGLDRTAVEITAGFNFACARLDDGAIKCWGEGGAGQVGVGDSDAHPSPTQAVDLGTGLKAFEIAAGLSHTCARLDGGIVKCWGDNDKRALGIPDPLNRGANPGELGDALPPVPLGP